MILLEAVENPASVGETQTEKLKLNKNFANKWVGNHLRNNNEYLPGKLEAAVVLR